LKSRSPAAAGNAMAALTSAVKMTQTFVFIAIPS
jgi:hypothetical protein